MQSRLSPNGEYWNWTAHQFRTFFATIYFWRFDYPSLPALSEFLRHFSSEMTEVYVTRLVQGSFLKLLDEKYAAAEASAPIRSQLKEMIALSRERRIAFDEVAQEFIFEIARRAATAEERLTGLGGEAWQREIDRLAESLEPRLILTPIGTPGSSFQDILKAWAADKTITPHPAGHGLCKCGTSRTDLDAAACVAASGDPISEVRGPDLRHAVDLVCAGCIHNIMREHVHRRYWLDAQREADAASRCANSEEERERALKRLDDISLCLRKFYGKH